MKIKKFKNIWTMGLILFGAILVLFYIAKIFFPEFIVGVAEIPSIVAFGNFVDNNKWAFYLYTFAISYIGSFIYCNACCRTRTLKTSSHFIIIGLMVLSFLLNEFCPILYAPYNYASNLIMPFLIILNNKNCNKSTFISTCVCYSVDIMAQALSLYIRDIIVMSSCINSATMTILLIDTWIWRILLYLFFNNKNKKESE